MRYVLSKINDRWWVCLEGPGMFIGEKYEPMLLAQHELIMDFPWFDSEGSYVMDDDLIPIPEGSKLRETAETYPDREVKVKFKDEIYDKIQLSHNNYIDSLNDTGLFGYSDGD